MPILPYAYQRVEDLQQKDERLTDLAVIGVPAVYQSQKPRSEAYPERFDPECRPVWELMLNSDEYKLKITGQTLDGSWHQAIQLFIQICRDMGLNPLATTTDTPANEYVQYQVKKYRMQLVKYIDSTNLFTGNVFEPLTVRSSYREYVRTNDGLIISSWADMFPYPNVVKSEYYDWLSDPEGPRFIRYVDNHFVHVVVPQVQVWIKCINMLRIQVGFTIEVKGTIDMPGNKSPTRKEVDAFLDRTVWLPLLRQLRFKGVTQRLF